MGSKYIHTTEKWGRGIWLSRPCSHKSNWTSHAEAHTPKLILSSHQCLPQSLGPGITESWLIWLASKAVAPRVSWTSFLLAVTVISRSFWQLNIHLINGKLVNSTKTIIFRQVPGPFIPFLTKCAISILKNQWAKWHQEVSGKAWWGIGGACPEYLLLP